MTKKKGIIAIIVVILIIISGAYYWYTKSNETKTKIHLFHVLNTTMVMKFKMVHCA